MKNMTETEVKLRKPSDIVREKESIKGDNGETMDPFNLHALIFVGNTKDGIYDLSQNYTRWIERSIGIDPDHFDEMMQDEIWGETDEEKIIERYREELRDTMLQRLF